VEKVEAYDGVSALSGEQAAVRVMNLHQAKGLEARVVFLADPTGFSVHKPVLHVDRAQGRIRGYLAIYGASDNDKKKWQKPQPLACPPGWADIAKEEEQFLRAEELRLRYVAATRAASLLVISTREQYENRNAWSFFSPHLDKAPELVVPPTRAASDKLPHSFAREESGFPAEAMAARLATVLEPTYHTEGAKSYALSESRERPQSEDHAAVSSPETVLEDSARAAVESGQKDVEDPIAWGEVLHKMLEEAMRRPGMNLEEMARVLLPEHGLDIALAPVAAEEANAVLGSDLWCRASASSRRMTEVPFELRIEDNGPVAAQASPKPVLIRGVVDLAFYEDGGWVLVDYKTDSLRNVSPAALLKKYAPQLRLYGRAWAECAREPVKELGLFLTRAGQYLPLPAPSLEIR
jgi:ATP-dependent helicase/nuclease subunit A